MSEYSKIAQARLAELMELQGRRMPPATHLAKAENQAGATQSIKTIRNFFNTSQWKTVIIKDGDRLIGYITADALLRAQNRTQDAAILV
ncbi:CBS domain-containing protein [Yoonia vestfoldensis]|uniref:CBS domain-containing protein n=2 Tax=Yoonia vestfoldensis TaxID=245188 RepID=A0A1Y0EGX5_9RHOB|nr:CBS domain-containing protein [Yoonia vestfoldensis]